MAISSGSTVGSYRVLKKLGSGAMGAVFLAQHPSGLNVALKIIHPELADKEEMVSRFFTEARAVNQIGHPNIIEVMDFGQTPGGDNFIVMELLEGMTLGERIKLEGIIDLRSVLHIGIQMTEGLAASHERGIIHRDLKPDNVFLIDRDGDSEFVKILDFGLAKLTSARGGGLGHKTQSGAVLGTPHYMAPEQCEGRDVDPRCDVYALGCLLYEMVCGRVPFPGEGFGEVLIKHLRESPVPPSRLNPEVTPAVEKIIQHALAKKREFRFQTMLEFGVALSDPDRFARALEGGALSSETFEMLSSAIPLIRGDSTGVSRVEPEPQPQHIYSPKAHEEAPTLRGSVTALEEGIERARRSALAAQELETTHPDPSWSAVRGTPQAMPRGAATAPRPAAAALVPSFDDNQPFEERPSTAIGRGRSAGKGRSSWPAVAVAAALLVVGAGGAAFYFITTGRAEAPAGEVAVLVNTQPLGAEVLQDGKLLGHTPLLVKVARDRRGPQIVVHKPGFLDVKQELAANQPQVEVTLVAVHPTATAPPPTDNDTLPRIVPPASPGPSGTAAPAASPPAPAEPASSGSSKRNRRSEPPPPPRRTNPSVAPSGEMLEPSF